MANTGYIINPYVTQVFTTGPNSGSMVPSSSIVTFNSGSGFTSSSACNNIFYNKVYNPVVCAIPGHCVNPTINQIYALSCDSGYNYIYNMSYNINSSSLNIPQSIVEYSLNNSFSGPTGSTILLNSGSSNSINVNIASGSNPLNPLPLNQYTPVYFRIKNTCSGSGTSLPSNIYNYACPTPPVLYRIFINHTADPGLSYSETQLYSNTEEEQLWDGVIINGTYTPNASAIVYVSEGDSISMNITSENENTIISSITKVYSYTGIVQPPDNTSYNKLPFTDNKSYINSLGASYDFIMPASDVIINVLYGGITINP